MIDPWEFFVEESFTITGRGTGVIGELQGVLERSGEPADLRVGETLKQSHTCISKSPGSLVRSASRSCSTG
jgi:hypothetical protein